MTTPIENNFENINKNINENKNMLFKLGMKSYINSIYYNNNHKINDKIRKKILNKNFLNNILNIILEKGLENEFNNYYCNYNNVIYAKKYLNETLQNDSYKKYNENNNDNCELIIIDDLDDLEKDTLWKSSISELLLETNNDNNNNNNNIKDDENDDDFKYLLEILKNIDLDLDSDKKISETFETQKNIDEDELIHFNNQLNN
jgi:hypothetical protein